MAADKTGAIEALLARLTSECQRLGMDTTEALQEKADELAIRRFLKCIPDRGLKETQWVSFLQEVLAEEPSRDLLESIRLESREAVLDKEEYIELEREQGSRCALCGTLLRQSAKPHIDHIVPISLGGKNDKANLQLLCQECNLGKSKLLGWIMGAPFLDEGRSLRLRYCVLTRYGARCSVPDCGESAQTTALEVLPIVPVQRGGRLIFDNLRAVCDDHGAELRRRWKDEAYAKYRGLASLAWSRGRPFSASQPTRPANT